MSYFAETILILMRIFSNISKQKRKVSTAKQNFSFFCFVFHFYWYCICLRQSEHNFSDSWVQCVQNVLPSMDDYMHSQRKIKSCFDIVSESNLILVEEEYWKAILQIWNMKIVLFIKLYQVKRFGDYRDYESAKCWC